jgi:hypothetical protein
MEELHVLPPTTGTRSSDLHLPFGNLKLIHKDWGTRVPKLRKVNNLREELTSPCKFPDT